MLKVDVGSLVGVLAFISAIFLAIVVILFNDLGRGLRLDRHLIITRVLHLPYFVLLTTALCGLLFTVIVGETLEWTWFHRIYWALVMLVSFIYFMSAILILISVIAWLNSEEHSSPWRGSYREEQRLRYLTRRDYPRTLLAWQEFWQDEKTYVFLGNGHFLPYVGAFFDYLLEAPVEYEAEVGELFNSFMMAMLRIQRRTDMEFIDGLFGCIIVHYERAYFGKSYQRRQWDELVRSYMRVAHLQDLAMLDVGEEAGFLRENPEFITNQWWDDFDFYLTDGFSLRDAQAIRALARTIWQYYQIVNQRGSGELKKHLRARRKVSYGAMRRLCSELIKAVDAPDSRSLAEFLLSQTKPKDSNK